MLFVLSAAENVKRHSLKNIGKIIMFALSITNRVNRRTSSGPKRIFKLRHGCSRCRRMFSPPVAPLKAFLRSRARLVQVAQLLAT